MSSIAREPHQGRVPRNSVSARSLKSIAKRTVLGLTQAHIPVGQVNRPMFSLLYHLHVLARESLAMATRFFWYEPLFRSQCHHVGAGFVMEQLPYLYGQGEIVIGDDVRFSGKQTLLFSSRHCSCPSLTIGAGSFLGHNSCMMVASRIEIGNHTLIASGVRISDFDGHPLDAEQRRRGEFVAPDRVLPVRIGEDVWIGHGATVLKGVTIGDRSIIGAGAVVTRNIPADCIAAGNPARIVKHLVPPVPAQLV